LAFRLFGGCIRRKRCELLSEFKLELKVPIYCCNVFTYMGESIVSSPAAWCRSLQSSPRRVSVFPRSHSSKSLDTGRLSWSVVTELLLLNRTSGHAPSYDAHYASWVKPALTVRYDTQSLRQSGSSHFAGISRNRNLS
jgi:hypothetical protein